MLTQKDIKRMIDDWETEAVEFKRAKGAVPASFWESYSAFANTDGGVIVLGVAEKRYSKLMFRNPGCLRMAKEAAIGGGRSDARNSRIFNIFSLINIGERSGTGLSDIFSIWKEYGYEQPSITETYQPDQTTVTVRVELEEVAATTQERAGTTQERAGATQESTGTTQERAVKTANVAVKDAVTTQEVAPKNGEVALKIGEIAPKDTEVAPKIAPKETDVAPKDKDGEDNAVKSAVKNLVNDESVVEKCVALWSFLKEDPQRTITNAVERLSCSRRSIISYIGILKQAKVLEHIGPYRGGEWKFLI